MIRPSLAQLLAGKSKDHSQISRIHQTLFQKKEKKNVSHSHLLSQSSSNQSFSGSTPKQKRPVEDSNVGPCRKSRRKSQACELPVSVPSNRTLQCSKVKPQTLKSYHEAVQQFLTWASSNRKRVNNHQSVDESISEYIHYLCWEGYSITFASYAVFGYIMLQSPSDWHMTDKSKLPVSRMALKGWRSRFPGKTRTGVDLVLWDLVALCAAQRGFFLTAFGILIQGDSYLRPSELITLQKSQLLPPRRQQTCWGIVVGLSEQGVPAKNGEFDECVFLDTPSRIDINSLLTTMIRRSSVAEKSVFSGLTLEKYEKQITIAAEDAGLSQLRLCPHMLRHSGASHDSYHKLRNIKDIQVRGRWKALVSVARYRKPGLMLLAQSAVKPSVWKRADAARSQVIRLLSAHFSGQ